MGEEDSDVHSSHEEDELELNNEKVKTIDDDHDYLIHERSEPNHVNPSEKAEMYMMPETDHANVVPPPYKHDSSQPTIIQNHYHKHEHHQIIYTSILVENIGQKMGIVILNYVMWIQCPI